MMKNMIVDLQVVKTKSGYNRNWSPVPVAYNLNCLNTVCYKKAEAELENIEGTCLTRYDENERYYI